MYKKIVMTYNCYIVVYNDYDSTYIRSLTTVCHVLVLTFTDVFSHEEIFVILPTAFKMTIHALARACYFKSRESYFIT